MNDQLRQQYVTSLRKRMEITEDLRNRAELSPAAIEIAQLRHAELQIIAKNWDTRVKESEAEIIALLLEDPDQKENLKNEQRRNVTIQRALATNTPHQTLVKDSAKATMMAKDAAREAEKRENEWRSISAQISLIGSQVALIELLIALVKEPS